MEFTLTRAREDVVAVLGEGLAMRRPDELVLNEGIRDALRFVSERATPEEVTITIVTTGREQALTTILDEDDEPVLGDLLVLLGLYWPWTETDSSLTAATWRSVRPGVVWFESGIPQAADLCRVVFRRLYTLRELENAAATTLPVGLERPVVLAACGYVLEALARHQVRGAADGSDAAAERYRQMARSFFSRADAALGVGQGSILLDWSSAGLNRGW